MTLLRQQPKEAAVPYLRIADFVYRPEEIVLRL
jgi:hypothetical protein